MGKTMKRVPMDFDWPSDRVWKGYLNPYRGVDCPWCYDETRRHSHGMTKEARKYERGWYGYDSDNHFPNPYHPGRYYHPFAKPYTLEQWEYDFIIADDRLREHMFASDKADVPPFEGIKDWLMRYYGNLTRCFDVLDIYMMTEEYCRRNGYTLECPRCKGTGTVWQTEEIQRLHEEWEDIEPPTGDGWQLWETTSEGSPQSPVFATFDELCEWCAENAFTFAHYTATKEEWAQMLNDDFVYHQRGNMIMT